MRLQNKVAVVTGAAQGIGRAAAVRLAEEGADLVLMDLDDTALQATLALVAGLGRRCMATLCDLTDRAALQRAFAAIPEQLGPVDVLINNVGQGARERAAPFWESDPALDDFMHSVCLQTTIDCTRQVVPGMRERRAGQIVNIASDSAYIGSKAAASYAAAKAGVIGFTRSLSRELAQFGITVNAIAPGYIRTRAQDYYAMGSSMTRDLTAIITKRGGTVVGSVAHPFPNTTDFSSYLLQAQASGADVLCLANSGTNAVNCIKQAAEFGLLQGGKLVVAAPLVEIPQIHEIGAQTAQGMYTASSFYWDRNDASRAFTARLKPLNEDYVPNQNHAGAYAATMHYLKAVAKLGAAAAKADGRAVVAAMKQIPAEDPLFGRSIVREDGRVIHDMYLLQAKRPAEMQGPWDYMRIVATVPGETAFRPLSDGGCPMVKS